MIKAEYVFVRQLGGFFYTKTTPCMLLLNVKIACFLFHTMSTISGKR